MGSIDGLTLLRDAILLTLKLSAPMLLVAMAVGLVVAILQTTTSIQEQTLTFVPKMIAIFLVIVIFASWMIQSLMDYTEELFSLISKL